MRISLSLMALSVLLAASPAPAQSRRAATAPPPQPPLAAEEVEAPYDVRLARLSEILGALSYLRPLCGAKDERWRADMQAILDADTANEPNRRAKMTAAFNRGYRAFSSVHTACSPAARIAEGRYRAEAATVVAEITGRFGN